MNRAERRQAARRARSSQSFSSPEGVVPACGERDGGRSDIAVELELPDQQPWWSTPLRASLVGLIGTSLGAAHPSPAMAAFTGVNSSGVCSVDSVTISQALNDAACTSLLFASSDSITVSTTLTKPATIAAGVTISLGDGNPTTSNALTLNSNLILNGLILLEDNGMIRVNGSPVSISSSSPSPGEVRRLSSASNSALSISSTQDDPVQISNVTFSDSSTSSAPLVSVEYSRVDMTGVTFTQIQPQVKLSSALSLVGYDTDARIQNSTFSGHQAQLGSAMRITDGAQVLIASTTFQDNSAVKDAQGYLGMGGAIYAYDAGPISITGSEFVNNTAAENGGAIHIVGGSSLSVVSTSFESNTAQGAGGAIHAINVSDISVSTTSFTDNSAHTGGAMHVYGDNATTSVSVTDSTLSANQAVSIVNANNQTVVGKGGAIWVTAVPNLTVAGSALTQNTASGDGGAGFVKDVDSVTISATTMESNTASRSGGSLYVESASVAVLADSVISRNRAVGSVGGAFQLEGAALSITDSEVSENQARDGGAIYGGAGSQPSTVSILRSVVRGNEVDGNSGAIQIGGAGSLTISRSTIADNVGGWGGAIGLFSNSHASIADSTVSGNTATWVGAIYARGGSLTLRNTTLWNNHAGSYVGGIYANGSTVAIESSSLVNNEVDNAANGSRVNDSAAALFITGAPQNSSRIVNSLVMNSSETRTSVVIDNGAVAVSYSAFSDTPTSQALTFETGTLTGVSMTQVFGSSGPALADNGGPTFTLALRESTTADQNPVVDAGSQAGQSEPTFDQRGTGFSRRSGAGLDMGAFEFQVTGGSGSNGNSSGSNTSSTPAPVVAVTPLVPTVLPELTVTGSTVSCSIAQFSDAPSEVDVTLVVGGVRQPTRRIAMPATTVSWDLDSLWRGQSMTCEVVAKVANRVATAFAPTVTIPSVTTPSPTPTPTPTPTTPGDDATSNRGFAAASVRFNALSSALDASDRRVIADLVKRSGADGTFRVTGFVQGTRVTSNDRTLSAARARAVAAELQRLGVLASNITTVAGGRSVRGGAEARRVSIVVRWTK